MPINLTPGSGKLLIRSTAAAVTLAPAIFDGVQAPPTVSTLTWFNQDNSTASDGVGVINISIPSGNVGNSRRTLAVTAPATPWTFDVGFTWTPSYATPYPVFGLCVYEQSTGKLVEWDLYWNGSVFHAQWSKIIYNGISGAAYSDAQVSYQMSPVTVFLRYVDDGTNLSVYWSNDNVNWTQWGSAQSRTDYLASGPSHVGLCMDAVANVGASLSARVFHWKLH